MTEPIEHSRRDFLQGRAAARALADQAAVWVDSASQLLPVAEPPEATPHLRASRRAMACEFALQYHAADRDAGDDVLAALDLIESLESQMTVYRDQSDVIDINNHAGERAIKVEPQLFDLLQTAARLYGDTGGAFDITSTPLSQAWGFLRRDGQVPEEADLCEALDRVGFDKVELDADRRTIRFREPAVQINLNSIGKGYALDRATELLERADLTDYLWHGGSSSVLARGVNRADRARAWTIGLRHPLEPERRVAEFRLRDRALATTGGATQCFEHHGRRYSHILDPRTGWPAEGVYTATVLAPTAAEADGLATAMYVLGPESARDYCNTHPKIGALLVCPATSSPDRIEIHSMGLADADWSCLMSAKPGADA